MRIVFFSKGGIEITSSRYRCYRVAAELRRQGIGAEVCDPPPAKARPGNTFAGIAELWRLHRSLAGVSQGDIVYMQSPLQNRSFVGLAIVHKRLRGLIMVFDFCEPMQLRWPRRMRYMTRAANLVIVSSPDLAAYARRYNTHVHVIPNSLPAGEISERPVDNRATPAVVGWVGDARIHRANLELLIEPFARVAAHTPFVFRMVGARRAEELVARFSAIPGLQVDAIDWVEHDKVREIIGTFDVAVVPLTDIEWNRKLVTKLVEYLGAGIPIVASPVGDNRVLLRDAISGFLASDAGEWASRVSALLNDPGLRNAIATEGLQVVRERCRLDTNVTRLAGILGTLAPSMPIQRR